MSKVCGTDNVLGRSEMTNYSKTKLNSPDLVKTTFLGRQDADCRRIMTQYVTSGAQNTKSYAVLVTNIHTTCTIPIWIVFKGSESTKL